MDRRISVGAAAGALLLGTPLAAPAQSAITYYNPAKLVSRGAPTSSVAGAGTVVVQVLVNKDGSFKVQRIIRSTNHGDDAAALEIAKASKYKPATRGSAPQTSFYDFTLNFTGSGGTAAASGGAASGPDQYLRMLTAGNYSGAQSGLKTYLADHPGDQKAELYLGLSDSYLSQPADAAAAYDKAGSIPANYTATAAKSYNDAASAALKAGDKDAAIADAKRAVELRPGLFTYNTLGFAELSAGSNDAAVADFEKARTLGASDATLKAADRARVDGNLISAYLATGKTDQAKAVAAEAKSLDPAETGSATAFSSYYIKAAQAAADAGKQSDAAGFYEQAATADPSQAAGLYGQAAIAYLNAKPNADDVKAKADADKALALDPDNAVANFAAGVAVASTPGKSKDALPYLTKADASAKKANNTSLTTAIENVLKQLNGNK